MKTAKWILGCALVALAPVGPATAQYSLSQYAIAGGGGQATGGGWTLNATIGQAAAGTASGGGLTLVAGFWCEALLQAPQLSIALSGTNVVLSWPSSAVGFVLQQTPTLAGSVWTPVTAAPADNGIMKTVTLPLAGAGTYYRLAR